MIARLSALLAIATDTDCLVAQSLYEYFVEVARRGSVPVETGVFQASMDVRLLNQGPVTIVMDSDDRTRK